MAVIKAQWNAKIRENNKKADSLEERIRENYEG